MGQIYAKKQAECDFQKKKCYFVDKRRKMLITKKQQFVDKHLKNNYLQIEIQGK